MRRFHRLAFTIIVFIVVYYIVFRSASMNNPNLDKWFAAAFANQKINIWINDIITEVLPMLVAVFFGGLGGHLHSLANLNNGEVNQSNPDLRKNETAASLEVQKEVESSTSGYRLRPISDSAEVQLGMIMGLVGHFVLSSKALIRIFYPSVPLEGVEATFVGTAFISLAFGYFARDLLGISKRVVANKIRAFEGSTKT